MNTMHGSSPNTVQFNWWKHVVGWLFLVGTRQERSDLNLTFRVKICIRPCTLSWPQTTNWIDSWIHYYHFLRIPQLSSLFVENPQTILVFCILFEDLNAMISFRWSTAVPRQTHTQQEGRCIAQRIYPLRGERYWFDVGNRSWPKDGAEVYRVRLAKSRRDREKGIVPKGRRTIGIRSREGEHQLIRWIDFEPLTPATPFAFEAARSTA